MNLFEIFKENIQKNLTEKTGLLTAVSGGADSICLLHLLSRLQKEIPFSVHAAHVNYNLRDESAEDMNFVKEQCRILNIPVHVLECSKPDGVNTQNWARDVRYDFFRKICAENSLDHVCTAHNLGDQAETILLHLCRGTGIYGLQGMKPCGNSILRPLLNIPRIMIEFWLNIEGIPFRNDASNSSDAYSRNFIRHHIIPLFEELNPRFLHDISKTAQIHADLIKSFDHQTKDLPLPADNEEFHLDLHTVSALDSTLQKHYIHKILSCINHGSGQNVSGSNIEAIASLINAETGKKHIFSGIIAEKSYNSIVFYHSLKPPAEIILDGTGPTELNEYYGISSIYARVYDKNIFDSHKVVDNAIFFDYNTLNFPLKIRGKQDGDRFCPCGMNGRHVKLKNFFSNKKIERRFRHLIPILCDNSGKILAVMGIRRSDHAYISQNTEKVLVLEFY